MATAFISTSTELTLLNTTTRQGVIILPTTATIPGRILTFKDTRGQFGVSSITFSTAAAGQTLENNAISATYNDPFGAYSFVSGFDNKWYTIGGSRMFAANISSITSIRFTSLNISTTNITTSTLQIRDFATTSTNTLFSLSTNVFMSSPTNFFIVGPTKAPKSLFTPIRGPFLPNQLASLALWFDAQDINTIRLTNGLVSNWADKSSNRRRASPPTPANSAQYIINSAVPGQPAIRFANSASINQYFLVSPFFQMAQSQVLTIFAVFNVTAATFNSPFGNFLLGHPGFDCGFVLNYFPTLPNSTIYATYYNNANTQFTAQQIAISNNLSYLVAMTFTVSSGINSFVWINGGNQTTNTNASGLELNTNRTSLNIGGNAGAGNNVDVCELILYQSSPTNTQRQQVEGYLAWKWGLVSSLPSNHPYKNSPP